jgi:hypothetical protein
VEQSGKMAGDSTSKPGVWWSGCRVRAMGRASDREWEAGFQALAGDSSAQNARAHTGCTHCFDTLMYLLCGVVAVLV